MYLSLSRHGGQVGEDPGNEVGSGHGEQLGEQEGILYAHASIWTVEVPQRHFL